MKLLLDQNLSRRLVPRLKFCFEGTSQVALIGLDKSSDIEIWTYARDNGFVLVTKDSDFEELSMMHGSPPKVLWLKSGNTNNQYVLKALIDNNEFIHQIFTQSGIDCLEIF